MALLGICRHCKNKQRIPHVDVRCRRCGRRGFAPDARPHRKSATKRARMLDRAATPELRRLVEFILDEFGTISEFARRFSSGRGGIQTDESAVHRWIAGKTGASWPRARRLANMMRSRGWEPVELAPGAVDMWRRKVYRYDHRKWRERHPETDPGRPGGFSSATLRQRRRDAGPERATEEGGSGGGTVLDLQAEAPSGQAAEPAQQGDGLRR